jgi:hypothetical protein
VSGPVIGLTVTSVLSGTICAGCPLAEGWLRT